MEVVKDVYVALKGFAMGVANVIPGVSGGTIALISGIYHEIVDSLDSLMSVKSWKGLFKNGFASFWKEIHGEFLLSLVLGVLVSIFTFAKLMEYCLQYHPIQTWALFFGFIAASAILMLKDIKGWKLSDIVITVIGVALGLVVCTLSPTETRDDSWFIFVCGAIAICTMILPGISGSFVLVILGKYDYIMGAISELNVPVLIAFFLGCAVGILAFAKLLHILLAKWEKQTLLLLVGFVIGSLIKVWPWSNGEALRDAQLLRTGIEAPLDLQIPGAIIFAAIGVAIIIVIDRISKRK